MRARLTLLAAAAVVGLGMASPAGAQNTGVNPQPGSLWTYLGATYGAGWVYPILASFGYVASNAVLAATVPSTPQIYRAGFYAPGDGGAATYTHSNTPCSIAGGVGDNGSQVRSTTGGCWLLQPGTHRVPEIWGAKGDGTTNDTVTFQAALNGSAGQHLWQGDRSTYLIGSVTMPVGTTFKGTFANVGAPNYHSTQYNFGATPALRLSGTISMLSSATIDGVLIYRAGMTFPAANSSAFAGTAIAVTGDSPTIKNSLIMGFDLGVTSGFDGNGRDRGLIENVNFDNQSNIKINAAGDTWKIHNVHAWPWATAFSGNVANDYRTGTNFYQSNSNDASLISDYLAFGYATGFAWDNNSGSTCTNCDADGDQEQVGVKGFSITGGNARTTLINPKIYGRAIGVYVNTSGSPDASQIYVYGGIMAGIKLYGVQIDAGSSGLFQMSSVNMSAINYAMQILSASEIVSLTGNYIGTSLQSVPINVPIVTSNVRLGPDNIFGDPVTDAGRTIITGNVSTPTIAVASGSLSLPPFGSVFRVANGGTVGFINAEWAGRVVTLVFEGVTTLNNTSAGGFGAMMLNGSANFVSTANSTLTLVATGATGWYEAGRMKP